VKPVGAPWRMDANGTARAGPRRLGPKSLCQRHTARSGGAVGKGHPAHVDSRLAGPRAPDLLLTSQTVVEKPT